MNEKKIMLSLADIRDVLTKGFCGMCYAGNNDPPCSQCKSHKMTQDVMKSMTEKALQKKQRNRRTR